MACPICRRTSCTRSFHSIEAQERYDKKQAMPSSIDDLREMVIDCEEQIARLNQELELKEEIERKYREGRIRLVVAKVHYWIDGSAFFGLETPGKLTPAQFGQLRRDLANGLQVATPLGDKVCVDLWVAPKDPGFELNQSANSGE